MRAVTVPTPGGPDSLVVADVPAPTAGPGEVVIDVVAAGVNRADILQRMGFYPPPPGHRHTWAWSAAGGSPRSATA